MAIQTNHHVGGERFERTPTTFGQAAKEVFGLMCLLAGMAMTATLFLLPVGIPVALLGVALIVTAEQ